jgi:hypothetical protein
MDGDGLLTLTFDETMKASSLTPSAITLHRSASDIVGYTLTGGVFEVQGTSDDIILELVLNKTDLDLIKFDSGLATSSETTWLRFDSAIASDMADNLPLTVAEGRVDEAMQVTNFDKDSTPPTLDSFDLNMNTGRMVLSFSETVSRSTLIMTRVHLRVSSLAPASFSFTGTSLTFSADGTELEVTISDADLNEIKRLPQLAIDAATTVLLLDENAVQDMSTNAIAHVPSEFCTGYTKDVTKPQLNSFDLDMTSGILKMTFTETVKASTFDVTGATLRVGEFKPAANDGSGVAGEEEEPLMFVETASVVVTSTSRRDFTLLDGLVQAIELSVQDLNLIKRASELAVSQGSTFVGIGTSLVEDMHFNTVEEVEAKMAFDFNEDNRSPTLDSFDLDMSTRLLTLHFSETVDVSTIDVTQLTLVSPVSPLSAVITLSETSICLTDEDSHIVAIQISIADANEVKLVPALAHNSASTGLSFTNATVDDMNKNDLVSGTIAVTASTFVADLMSPVPKSFAVDMTAGVLYITFDEPIDAESLKASRITLNSGVCNDCVAENEYAGFKEAPSTYTLLTGSSIAADGLVLEVKIDTAELHEIKFLRMFTTNGDSSLSLLGGVVTDLATAASDSIATDFSHTAAHLTSFTADASPPTLDSYTFDLTTGVLHMIFSEPVNTRTILENSITLQNTKAQSSIANDDRATSTHNIDSATICDDCQSSDGLAVDLKVSAADLEQLKFKTDLFTNGGNSFISLATGLIKDMAGVNASAISTENAMQAGDFIADSIQPFISTFDLDMDEEILTISFSEMVNYGTTNFLAISLSSSNNVSSETDTSTVQLSSGLILNTENGPFLAIKLDLADLNKMKADKVGVSKETTFLTVTSLAIKDMAGLQVVALTNGIDAKAVTNYKQDKTPPVLTACALDLTLETLTMKFTETVDARSLLVSGLTIQEHKTSTEDTNSLALSEPSATDDADNSVVVVDLGLDDLNEIKRLTEFGLALSQRTVWCSGAAFLKDVFGNEVVSISADDAVSSNEFNGDFTAPKLLAFDLELNHTMIEDKLVMGAALLRLSFSETVQFDSYNPTELTLLGSPNGDSSLDVTLTGYYMNLTTASGTIVTFKLSRSDTNVMKRIATLATSTEDTYVSITNAFVKDMNDNAVEEISRSAPLKVQQYVHDDRPPELFRFSIDMDEGSLSLTFDETVNGASLIPDEILLRDHTDPTSSVAGMNLTGAYGVNGNEAGELWVKSFNDLDLVERTFAHEDSSVIKLFFLKVDLDEIKRLNICTENNDCYMTHSERLIYDMEQIDVDGCA